MQCQIKDNDARSWRANALDESLETCLLVHFCSQGFLMWQLTIATSDRYVVHIVFTFVNITSLRQRPMIYSLVHNGAFAPKRGAKCEGLSKYGKVVNVIKSHLVYQSRAAQRARQSRSDLCHDRHSILEMSLAPRSANISVHSVHKAPFEAYSRAIEIISHRGCLFTRKSCEHVVNRVDCWLCLFLSVLFISFLIYRKYI